MRWNMTCTLEARVQRNPSELWETHNDPSTYLAHLSHVSHMIHVQYSETHDNPKIPPAGISHDIHTNNMCMVYACMRTLLHGKWWPSFTCVAWDHQVLWLQYRVWYEVVGYRIWSIGMCQMVPRGYMAENMI